MSINIDPVCQSNLIIVLFLVEVLVVEEEEAAAEVSWEEGVQ